MPVTFVIISDFLIGFDSLQMRIVVYGSFLLIVLTGLFVRKYKNIGTVFGGTLFGSVLFYLITNFAFFYSPSMYPHNLTGVVSSYINALPFLKNTLLGDLFYVSVFFGVYELIVYYKRTYAPSHSSARPNPRA